MKILLLDIAWLAGILEGEGSFSLKTNRGYNGTICISIQMTDKDIMDRCAAILNTKVYGPYTSKQKKKDGSSKKETYLITVFGSHAASWMMTLYSFMGKRRQLKIKELLDHWKAQSSMLPRQSSCHPTIKMFSKGLCKSCYLKNYHKERKSAYIATGYRD